MGSHPYQADHAGELAGELIAYLRTKPRLAALGAGLGSQLQELEESLLDLRDERTLAVAVGAQLDQYGRLVRELRGALADADFRRFVEARILSNTCEGEADRLIQVLRILAGPLTAGTDVAYAPQYPAGCQLAVTRDTPLAAAMASRIAAQMVSITPAGVGLGLIESTPAAFTLDTGPALDEGELSRLIP